MATPASGHHYLIYTERDNPQIQHCWWIEAWAADGSPLIVGDRGLEGLANQFTHWTIAQTETAWVAEEVWTFEGVTETVWHR